ncbi:uncharacterized protein SAPINGB_P004648 [Magnusiomyces paraingens]|uniref:Uncharacterized protein n=1 Tax=Magnusiomyces paraingens TaxID=2606893 RepID=A0A5E8C318_9ASCO|nr:uncharacterized protein SAPINGB_P004648 [Saprochaete ingens]VVT55555.1 unnamed protein product [Saprochaete ingens]
MSAATTPRIAALQPAAVYVKSATCLSNEAAAKFLAAYIETSKDLINVAANTALRSENAVAAAAAAAASSAVPSAAKNGFVDVLAAEMAQNEKIIAQLQRVERTLHNYSESATPVVFESTTTSSVTTQKISADEPADDAEISKEERKRLKKERKKAERKSKLAKNEAAAAE